jgi:hypothetical protein
MVMMIAIIGMPIMMPMVMLVPVSDIMPMMRTGPRQTTPEAPECFLYKISPFGPAEARVVLSFREQGRDIVEADARVKITVEIAAEFPDGAADHVKRAVSENARSLSLKTADWE